MLNQREKLNQLKRNFESYSYYYFSIKEVESKIVEIETRLEGLSSPRMQAVFIENKSYKNNIIELSERKERLEKQKNKYLNKIHALKCLVELIPDGRDRAFVEDYYFNGVPKKEIAEKYVYHIAGISRKLNIILLEIIKNHLYRDYDV